MNGQFERHFQLFSKLENQSALKGILHGIEREALRIKENGKLSQERHPKSLGSALTHPHITTDYAESLLEFITEPHQSPKVALQQLADIHRFTMSHLPDEYLWPTSMPCYVSDEDMVELAHYGTSNIGKMKTLYRQGLKHRYGTMMQLISGIHYNFSMPESFWNTWYQDRDNKGQTFQDFKSEKYMGLVRNFKRMGWLIPYLFGASPALCSSFLQGKQNQLEFKSVGRGTIYMPHATSLRMSDLGYTNSAQANLGISYNSLGEYVESVRVAIRTPSMDFAKIPVRENGQFHQLNANVLQIENELYSSIRPKQVARSGEKPSEALSERGIEYIEIRALDVDPHFPLGISEQHFYFLDAFLLYCLLADSPDMDNNEASQCQDNMDEVVLYGRKPGLTLLSHGKDVAMSSWMADIFDGIEKVSSILDKAYESKDFSISVSAEKEKVADPDLTPSARLLATLIAANEDNGRHALHLSKGYKDQLLSGEYTQLTEARLKEIAQSSLDDQLAIEQADSVSFESFLNGYFNT